MPVISSKTESDGVFGYIPNPNIDISKEKENVMKIIDNVNYFINKNGCITVTTDGVNAGYMIYRDSKKYPIIALTSHCIILSPLITINLEWFSLKYHSLFMSNSKSAENNHFGEAIIDSFDIVLPEEDIIKNELVIYKNLIKKRKELKNKINDINNFFGKKIILNTGIELLLNELFSYKGRNDFLTELGIYLNQPELNSKKTIKVLSGSGKVVGQVEKSVENIKFISNKPILSVITRGRAGVLTYLPCGDYAGNTNTYPLYLKEEAKKQLNILTLSDEINYLNFLKIYLEPIFLDISSNGDLGVFPLKEIFTKNPIKILLPKLDNNINSVINIINKMNEKINYYEKKIEKIDMLLSKEIIY